MYSEMQTFAQWVLFIGNGDAIGISPGNFFDSTWIKIPPEMLIDENLGIAGLIDTTYPKLLSSYTNAEYLCNRAILAPRNKDVDIINTYMVNILGSQGRTYYSADTKVDTEHIDTVDTISCPAEFLNSLTSSSLPNHEIFLKICTPILLLRNINQSIGLCNGTRPAATKLGNKLIEACVLSENQAGTVTIPRIKLFSDKDEFPFILRRIQFPICVAFAMTINKSQGQTLERVGIYLWNPVFSHGQLYVAISRATSAANLVFLIRQQSGFPSCYTQNIVYKEVLQSVMEKRINP